MDDLDPRRHAGPVDLIPRLLVSAYACDPGEGSEPGSGWILAHAAARIAEHTTIITRANNVASVSHKLDAEGLQNVRVIGLDLTPSTLWWKKRLPLGTQVYYVGWQRALTRIATKLHAEQPFSLGFHATFAGDLLPCGLAEVRGLPLVWGPIAGGSQTPLTLYRYLGVRGAIQEGIRRPIVPAMSRLFGSRTAGRASLVLCQNDDAMERYSKRATAIMLCPNAVGDAFETFAHHPDRGRVLGVGRLVPLKGWSLAVRALARCPEYITLTLVGTGQDRGRLERLGSRLGVSHRLHFAGQLNREQVMKELSRASCFVFPSFHDSASWALAEAICAGVPVVGLNLAGPNVLIREAGGQPVDHASAALLDAIAWQMIHPPPPVSKNAWTVESLQARVQTELMRAYLAQGQGRPTRVSFTPDLGRDI